LVAPNWNCGRLSGPVGEAGWMPKVAFAGADGAAGGARGCGQPGRCGQQGHREQADEAGHGGSVREEEGRAGSDDPARFSPQMAVRVSVAL
jgi:hypothetical protein